MTLTGAVAPAVRRRSVIPSGDSWRLLDPQAADRPGDDQLLDLFGALEDVVGLLMALAVPKTLHPLGFRPSDPCHSDGSR
jgi:hypothetical protein